MKTMGRLIDERRRKLGWTMSKLAGEVGKSVMYISDILHDKRIPLKEGTTLELIGKKLKIDSEEIREAALVTKIDQNIDKTAGESTNAIRLALARKIISTDLTEEQIEELKTYLKKRG
jgi:transcriptional regulator with XRE-family HTH domain